MNTGRNLAREAVIFMLLGPIVVAPATFTFLQRHSDAEIKADAARAVYAFDVNSLPPGFRLENSVLVPLTNGAQLMVTDCAQAHPWVISSTPANRPTKPTPLPAGLTPLQSVESGSKNFEQIAPGATNGSDCVYFKGELAELMQKHGGHLEAVLLGDVNQVQIEKDYWAAYAKAKSQDGGASAIRAFFLSLWGFPAGLGVWLFYRLVRFAVKG